MRFSAIQKVQAVCRYQKRGFSLVCRPVSRSRNLAFAQRIFPRPNARFFATLNCPSMGDSISEGAILSLEKNVGDWVNVDDIILTIETDKTTIDVRATENGVITKFSVEVDDVVEVDAALVDVDTSAEKPAGAAATEKPAPEKAAVAETAPVAEAPKAAPKPAAAKPAVVATPVVMSGARTERRVALSRMRMRIAQRLKESQNTAASLTTFNEIDMTNLMALRSKYKDAFLEKHGVKLGFMSAFVQAATKALQAYPAVNAYMDLENKQMIYHDFVDISVAVASPAGLVVPVIRNCERMSFADVESQIELRTASEIWLSCFGRYGRWNFHHFQWRCVWLAHRYSDH
eukprot:1020155_1